LLFVEFKAITPYDVNFLSEPLPLIHFRLDTFLISYYYILVSAA
jgi:hypothetical protein